MTRSELLFVASCWLLLALLIWVSWQGPYATPVLAEEPCLRVTTGMYIRNYPPEGAQLNRRPAEWGTCYPFPPYQEP